MRKLRFVTVVLSLIIMVSISGCINQNNTDNNNIITPRKMLIILQILPLEPSMVQLILGWLNGMVIWGLK